jgi:hypothetical protein
MGTAEAMITEYSTTPGCTVKALAHVSRAMALGVANLLADEIRRGEFALSLPSRPLPRETAPPYTDNSCAHHYSVSACMVV